MYHMHMKHLLLVALLVLLPLSADAVGSSTTVIKKPQTLRKAERDVFVNKTGKSAKAEEEKQQKESEKKTKDVSYTHGPTGISVKHPPKWETYNLAKNAGFSVYPDEYTLDRVMHVIVDPVPQKKDMSLEELEKWFMNKSTLSTDNLSVDWYIPSFTFISSEDATLFGKPAKKIMYSGEFASEKFQSVQYLTSFDKKIYRVRFSVVPSKFDAALPVFDKMFATLKLKPVKTEVAPKGKTRR